MASNTADGETAKAKLHGRAFYESIGSPKFVLAPMVDQSEFVCVLYIYIYNEALLLGEALCADGCIILGLAHAHSIIPYSG